MADALYSNAGRLIGGNARAKRVAGTVASAIYAGDFVALVSSKASPISALGDAGTLAQNQEQAHDVFLGVALDAKLAGDTRDILIASAGECKYPCAALGSGSDIGAYVGPAGTGSGGLVGVADQIVAIVATPNLAFGRLSRAAVTGDTFLYFELAGNLTTTQAGPQAMA
ncbi:hypothetical protein J8F10_14370 [Gemmata sp. G18]|uniref:Uncharacterized protein n=1 Tax=Gemmata palustris TaxID=2822762 RepID=A0ABS5BRU4_9BACT|nr:hypothetical protein [Gemmata palustris]MBP3956462.1 hypothetical protein [Gemmata palustris]